MRHFHLSAWGCYAFKPRRAVSIIYRFALYLQANLIHVQWFPQYKVSEWSCRMFFARKLLRTDQANLLRVLHCFFVINKQAGMYATLFDRI